MTIESYFVEYGVLPWEPMTYLTQRNEQRNQRFVRFRMHNAHT
jgi:hypothetical protein